MTKFETSPLLEASAGSHSLVYVAQIKGFALRRAENIVR